MKVLEGKDGRSLDHAMDEQFVTRWVDFRDTAVMALEMKISRCDRASKILEGCPRRGGAWVASRGNEG